MRQREKNAGNLVHRLVAAGSIDEVNGTAMLVPPEEPRQRSRAARVVRGVQQDLRRPGHLLESPRPPRLLDPTRDGSRFDAEASTKMSLSLRIDVELSEKAFSLLAPEVEAWKTGQPAL